ncbi:MAG: GNAT family N-acetyltransferase [Mobilitalea sp.]
MTNIKIRQGTITDIDCIAQLYDDINDHLAVTTNYPGWRKGLYPIRENAEDGIKDSSLYVATKDAEIVGSFILRHEPEPAYLDAKWQAELDYESVLVIYTFVVNPNYLGQRVGQEMLRFAALYGKCTKMKALRLDVYEKNTPAIRLYEKCGFKYIDTVSLGLEEYGLEWFKLYEQLL